MYHLDNIIDLASKMYNKIIWQPFSTSGEYWECRYIAAETSGAGSYGHLARFKADVVNNFVERNNIKSILEFGCGDGNQLRYAAYPEYVGVDVSPRAVSLCNEKFVDDPTKKFVLYDSDTTQSFHACLVLSLDVIYHLVEDEIYYRYMEDLFCSADLYVMIYSSNFGAPQKRHVRHRMFTEYVAENIREFELVDTIQNRYLHNPATSSPTSHSDFYLFKRICPL